jgi:hypothetical protein
LAQSPSSTRSCQAPNATTASSTVNTAFITTFCTNRITRNHSTTTATSTTIAMVRTLSGLNHSGSVMPSTPGA